MLGAGSGRGGFPMRLRRLLSALAAATLALVLATLALALAAPRADILISIDKSAQQMTVTVDGEQRYVWPVSTGMRGYDTPIGRVQAVPHGARPLQPRVGRRADAAFDLLHPGGPRHPRLRPRQGDRHAGLAWLRAAGAGATPPCCSRWSSSKARANARVLLIGETPTVAAYRRRQGAAQRSQQRQRRPAFHRRNCSPLRYRRHAGSARRAAGATGRGRITGRAIIITASGGFYGRRRRVLTFGG